MDALAAAIGGYDAAPDEDAGAGSAPSRSLAGPSSQRQQRVGAGRTRQPIQRGPSGDGEDGDGPGGGDRGAGSAGAAGDGVFRGVKYVRVDGSHDSHERRVRAWEGLGACEP